MSTVQLTKEEFRALVQEDQDEYEYIEESDWDVDYKWQHMRCIVRHKESGKFYAYTVSRSGSPYSDYYYSYEDDGVELYEVEMHERAVVVKEWVAVNKEEV